MSTTSLKNGDPNNRPTHNYHSLNNPGNGSYANEEQDPGTAGENTYPVELSGEDDPEVENFIRKYGDVKVSYIDPPRPNPWFTRPYALNYFHNGRLFRTKHERTSAKLELFLDLVYVGIVSNIASTAVEDHDGFAFLKFVFVFIPAWQIWADMKEFMNYYFNDDLLQKLYVLWQIILLLIYDNNVEYVDDLEDNTGLLSSVLAYSVSRLSFALILIFYSFYIKEHQVQMRLMGGCTIVTSASWYLILLISDNNWAKCVFAALMISLEQIAFCLSVHPWTKKLLKLEYSTALNIEHEDERCHAFYVIAIGEFLYNIVSGSPLALGWKNPKISKGVGLTIQAFLFLGIYSHRDGSLKAVHALRRSATSSMIFVYGHFILIASLLIVGDAGADLSKSEHTYLPEDEFGVLVFYHVGILIGLTSLVILSLADKDLDGPNDQIVNRYVRIGFRIPIGILILGLTWTYDRLTTVNIIWLDTLLLILLYAYEFVIMNPVNFGLATEGVTRVQDF